MKKLPVSTAYGRHPVILHFAFFILHFQFTATGCGKNAWPFRPSP
jgi:hypothetical protein